MVHQEPMPKKILQPDLKAIREAHHNMVANLAQPLPSIVTLASNACMSLSKFRKLFQHIYGQNVYDYHLNARIEYAKKLLLENELTITQIAYKVGFSHHQSFIKTFMKYTQLSPNTYRQTYSTFNI
jgi:transcriptional regulator GlxA family with amidase domain